MPHGSCLVPRASCQNHTQSRNPTEGTGRGIAYPVGGHAAHMGAQVLCLHRVLGRREDLHGAVLSGHRERGIGLEVEMVLRSDLLIHGDG